MLYNFNKTLTEYRNLCVNSINKYIDVELAVSNRVAEIAKSFGIDKNKLRVSYIGTKVADTQIPPHVNNGNTKDFTILFMGYLNKVKGGIMFLDAIEHIPLFEARGICIKIASKICDKQLRERVEELSYRFKKLTIYNGYSHEDFPTIFKDVDLGIVPPLWEDNLPQVAIETIANGVPVLTSCFGGAHELNSHPEFVFNDREDLTEKILKIAKTPSLLIDYWKYAVKLTTMKMHIEELCKIYNE